MDRLTFFIDSDHAGDAIGRDLGRIFEVRILPVGLLQDASPGNYQVFDVNLHDVGLVLDIKKWLSRRPKGSKVIVAVDKTSRADKVQAFALGATDVIHRPVTSKALMKLLIGDPESLSGDYSRWPYSSFPSVGAAFGALESLFSAAFFGAPLDLDKVHAAGEQIVDSIEKIGLGAWIGCVRNHHSRTYQHSLIVTGLAVAFGQNLGFSAKDREKLAFAGMLHDIGKVRIPLAILEKTGRLDADETKIMRKHPEYGYEVLAASPGIPVDMLDMVVHHHEYLDGSGYPHGLRADEISDLVRIITISDIFGECIERLPQSPPMSGAAAYQVLLDLGPKLDQELVKAFSFATAIKIIDPTRMATRGGHVEPPKSH